MPDAIPSILRCDVCMMPTSDSFPLFLVISRYCTREKSCPRELGLARESSLLNLKLLTRAVHYGRATVGLALAAWCTDTGRYLVQYSLTARSLLFLSWPVWSSPRCAVCCTSPIGYDRRVSAVACARDRI